jgi:3-oxoacyl-[acyl-carrier protein] reductase
VIHYARTQAAALAMQGTRVICVAPGSIEFPGGICEQRKRDDPVLWVITAQIFGVDGGKGFVR